MHRENCCISYTHAHGPASSSPPSPRLRQRPLPWLRLAQSDQKRFLVVVTCLEVGPFRFCGEQGEKASAVPPSEQKNAGLTDEGMQLCEICDGPPVVRAKAGDQRDPSPERAGRLMARRRLT